MKIFFYFILPFILFQKFWWLFLGVIILIFVIPWAWWKRAPSNQPDTLIGKVFPSLHISLRNLALRTFATVVFILILPVLIILPFVFALMLPIVAAAKIFGKDPGATELPTSGYFLMSVLLFMITVGLLAPINVMPIALYFAFGEPAGTLLETLVIGKDAVRDDAIIGLTGICVVAAMLLLDSFWKLRQARQVENLPTSKVRSVAQGLVELAGTARKVSAAPGRRETIFSLHVDMFDYFGIHQQLEPFFLEDDTGKILVNPAKSYIRAGWVTDLFNLFIGFHEVILTGRVEKDERTDAVTRTLLDGDPVYVIGNAEIDPDNAGAAGTEGLVIRPSTRSQWNLSLWQLLFGQSAVPSGKDVLNVFFISDSKEDIARKHILRGVKVVSLLSLFWILTSGFLLWSSQWPVRQSIKPESWRNAYWRGPEPRSDDVIDYSVDMRFFRFELYVKDLTPHSYEAIPALIEALGYDNTRFREPATEALLMMLPTAREWAWKAIPHLVENLKDRRAQVVQLSIIALGSFGPQAEQAVPALVQQLKCQSTNTYEVSPDIIRFQAAQTLGRIGPPAAAAIPSLNNALNDRSSFVRAAAAEAIRKIGEDQPIQ